MKYSEEMRLIFKGYSKDEIAALKKAEEDEINNPDPEPNSKLDEEDDNNPKPDEEETIKKLEDYEAKIEALEKENKSLKTDISKLNNHQTLGEPEKKKDAADVMNELFNFKKKKEEK